MTALPSKELLSEVFGENVTKIGNTVGNNLTFETFDNMFSGEFSNHVINIYELAHLCKEWASEYLLSSYMDGGKIWWCYSNHINYSHLNIDADTEPEAIFKACQWIFDNKETK